MSKVVGFIVGAALIVAGVITGNPALIIQGATMIVTQAIVDLTAPHTPARQASEMVIQLGEQPRTMQIGETATAGSLVDGFDYGGKYDTDWEVLIIRLADHKCHSLTGFWVNDEYNTYTGDGIVSRYDDQLKIYFRGDTTTDPMPDIVLDNGPGWTSADVGEAGCDVIIAYKADKPDDKHPGWPGGRPRFLFVIKGALCYDPRLDSTVTGGSGSHRDDDPDTWEWSENAVICWYKFQRGVYANDDVTDQTKLLVGRGLSAEESPPEYIFAAANLCDTVAGEIWPYYEAETALPDFADSNQMNVSGDGRWMVRRYELTATMEIWDLAARFMVGSGPFTPGFAGITAGGMSIGNDGIVYWINLTSGQNLHSFSAAGGEVLTNTGGGGNPVTTYALATSAGNVALTTSSSSGYFLGAAYISDAKASAAFCVHSDDSAWGIFQPTGSSNQFELRQVVGGTDSHILTGPVTRSGYSGALICYSAAYSHFFIIMDGHILTVDDATWTVTDHGSAMTVTNAQSIPSKRTNASTFWDYFSEYSLADGSTLRTLSPANWAPNEAGLSGTYYDQFNHALVTAANSTPVTIEWLLLDRHGGYRVAGPIYASQEYLEVEEMFASATAGNIITREGSVELEPGQAKSIVASFTDDDILSGSEVTWNLGFLSDSDGEWVNTVVARYVEPDQRWNDHAAPVVRDTADILTDGGPREASITLRLVRYQPQALRIAETNRRLGRIWGRASVKLGPRFCELEEGDWVSWTSARYGFTKTFRIDAYGIDQKWQNTLTLREISVGVYADNYDFPTDGSQIPPIVTPPDIGSPEVDNWALAAVTLDSPGASVPALEITGSADDDDYVESIIVEYWLDDGVTDPNDDPDVIPWTSAGRFPPSSTTVDITSVVGAETYYAAVSYVVSGSTGDRLVLGPVTLAGFGTGVRTADTTFITADDTSHTADLG